MLGVVTPFTPQLMNAAEMSIHPQSRPAQKMAGNVRDFWARPGIRDDGFTLLSLDFAVFQTAAIFSYFGWRSALFFGGNRKSSGLSSTPQLPFGGVIFEVRR